MTQSVFPTTIAAVLVVLVTLTMSGCTPSSDYHTQFVEAGQAVCLDGKQLYFARSPEFDDGDPAIPLDSGYYDRFVLEQAELPVSTEGHTLVDFSIADPLRVSLPQGITIPYYGFPADRLEIGSDGTIGMGPNAPTNATLRDHFNRRQISLLPVDATSPDAVVSYAVTAEQVVVTFENVEGNTVQCQIFLSGAQESDVVVTYVSVTTNTQSGAIGLSNGQELPFGRTEFVETDFVGDIYVPSDLCSDSKFTL